MQYRLRTDTVFDEDNNAFLVYGIDAVTEKGEAIKSIADIFFDKDKAEEFIALCNKNDLSIVHLEEVVNDVLV